MRLLLATLIASLTFLLLPHGRAASGIKVVDAVDASKVHGGQAWICGGTLYIDDYCRYVEQYHPTKGLDICPYGWLMNNRLPGNVYEFEQYEIPCFTECGTYCMGYVSEELEYVIGPNCTPGA
jgi:hypothetical protein